MKKLVTIFSMAALILSLASETLAAEHVGLCTMIIYTSQGPDISSSSGWTKESCIEFANLAEYLYFDDLTSLGTTIAHGYYSSKGVDGEVHWRAN